MALTGTDIFIVERGGIDYQMPASDLKTFVQANYIAADITARDVLTVDTADEVYVVDASADPTVTTGGAKYIWDGAAYVKMAEDESFDVTIAPTNLGYTAAPSGGTVTSSTGTDSTIPDVDGTNAGLATPAMFTNSHVPATSAGSTATNPVIINAGTQVTSFSISGLALLP